MKFIKFSSELAVLSMYVNFEVDLTTGSAVNTRLQVFTYSDWLKLYSLVKKKEE